MDGTEGNKMGKVICCNSGAGKVMQKGFVAENSVAERFRCRKLRCRKVSLQETPLQNMLAQVRFQYMTFP